MADRTQTLLSGLNKSMVGLEIGPFYAPIAPKAEGWDTAVVDFADTASLRHTASTHSSQAIRDAAHKVEEVDFVWSGQPLDELCRSRGKQDYVLASHVIEHTPDLVGFLQQCSRLLAQDGVISLAVPDLRRCFDLYKSPTGTREVLTAFRERRTRHTPETLFEARGYAVTINGSGAWVRGDRSEPTFAGPFSHAVEAYLQDLQRPADAPYVDAHAWHFTPASFQLVMLELNVMGLIDFRIDWLEETEGAEFLTQLRRGKTRLPDDALQRRRLELMRKRWVEMLEVTDPTSTPTP